MQKQKNKKKQHFFIARI